MSPIDVLLDVRSTEEYASGHLRGARNIPVQELAARLDELGSRQARVAVYCRSGRRSAAAEALLRASGFERVIDLGSLEQAAAANPFAPAGLQEGGDRPMIVRQLFDAESFTFTYLIADARTKQAALIDPVSEQVERDLRLVGDLGLTLRYVLETHVHADHVTSAGLIAERTGAVTAASELGASCATQHLRDGDVVTMGDVELRALATPGHTRDSMSFYTPGHVFTGDALLVRGTGRTDFQNGDSSALYDSITHKLFTLPDETLVWPGHDYRGYTVSSIGEERRLNPRLAGKTREEFQQIMRELKLAPPKKIQIAVPANLACGRDAGGVG